MLAPIVLHPVLVMELVILGGRGLGLVVAVVGLFLLVTTSLKQPRNSLLHLEVTLASVLQVVLLLI
jgi:hypothetical protein